MSSKPKSVFTDVQLTECQKSPLVTEAERRLIREKANRVVKVLHLGKIIVWLVILAPFFELAYLIFRNK